MLMYVSSVYPVRLVKRDHVEDTCQVEVLETAEERTFTPCVTIGWQLLLACTKFGKAKHYILCK